MTLLVPGKRRLLTRRKLLHAGAGLVAAPYVAKAQFWKGQTFLGSEIPQYVYQSPNTTFPVQSFETAAGLTHTIFSTDLTLDPSSTLDFALAYPACSREGAPSTNFYSPSSSSLSGVCSQTAAGIVFTGQSNFDDGDAFCSIVPVNASGISPTQSPGGAGGEAFLLPTSPYTGKKGWAFSGSYVIGFKVSASNLPSDYPGTDFPAMWCLPTEYLDWAINATSTSSCSTVLNYIEPDYLELGDQGTGVVIAACQVNWWQAEGTGTFPNCNIGHAALLPGTQCNIAGGADFHLSHWYHTVFLTSADNGGNGPLIQRYFDFTLQSNATVDNANAPTPQTLDVLDSQHVRLIFGGHCGLTNPYTVEAIYVRQKDASGLLIV